MADKRGSLMVNGYKVGGKVDATLSSTSTNPIENQAIFKELKKYGVKFTYVDNTLTLVSNDGTALSTATIKSSGSNFNIPNVTNIVASKGNAMATLTWTDPNDISYEGVTLAKWAGTIVVQKTGSAPTSKDDGTIVFTETTRNQHKTTPLTISNLTNDTTYYFGVFPYTDNGVYNYDASQVVSVTPKAYTVYGMHINGSESNPANMITYLSDCANAGFTHPAKMNFSTGKFDWGDWANAFFIPKSCMLKYNGTVDYYLNENDETKKVDGTASDVGNSSYGGNAMMEWGQLWWKLVPDSNGNGTSFYIADAQVDDTYHAYNNVDCNGKINKHFYTPKYFGSNISNKLRSISGASNSVSTTAQQEIDLAKANNQDSSNPIWYTEVYADRLLINLLLVMMAKNMNTQAVYGTGRCASSNSSAIGNGTMNGKGMFWGSQDQTSGVKVFGMENWWGNIWRRVAGYMNISNVIYTKLTYDTSDGSTTKGYNLTGSGYVRQGSISGASGGYISAMTYTSTAVVPKTVSGSDSTYYADGCWFDPNNTYYAVCGGSWSNGSLVGAFYDYLDGTVSNASASIGAALSCKPVA